MHSLCTVRGKTFAALKHAPGPSPHFREDMFQVPSISVGQASCLSLWCQPGTVWPTSGDFVVSSVERLRGVLFPSREGCRGVFQYHFYSNLVLWEIHTFAGNSHKTESVAREVHRSTERSTELTPKAHDEVPRTYFGCGCILFGVESRLKPGWSILVVLGISVFFDSPLKRGDFVVSAQSNDKGVCRFRLPF